MTPMFSVIVPVYEQWNLVPTLLDNLARQSVCQSQFEVIIVDNGTAGFVPPTDLPANVSILVCTTPGSYAARNFGAERAAGSWLVFTDADCRPRANWLQALQTAIEAARVPTIFAGAVQMESATASPNIYEVYDMVKGIPQQRYVGRGYGATANLAVAASQFNQVGGFNAARLSGGDADFCRRAGAAGGAIAFVPEAVVGHPARATWNEVAVKSRRLKGGHILFGSPMRRLAWVARTMMPPTSFCLRVIRSSRFPLQARLQAVNVAVLVWLGEILEAGRLLAGSAPERR